MPKPIIAESSISINAPIEHVWQVMTDVNAYPQWNPFIVSVDTRDDIMKPGAHMKFFVEWADGKEDTSDEVVTEVVPPHESNGTKRAHWVYVFNGILHKLGMVHATRHQWLEQHKNGVTVYKTQEVFTGLLKGFVPLAKVQDGFERQAKALAHFAEQQ